MRRRRGRIILWGALVVLLAAGLTYSFWPRPMPVDLGEATRGPMRVTIDDEGETRVTDVYVVSAPLSGRLLRIERDVGDSVQANETVVVTIRPREPDLLDVRSHHEAEAVVKAAEAAMTLVTAEQERARAELRFAETELLRKENLAKRGNISQRGLDSARLDVKIREAAVAAADAALQVKRFDLETARVHLIPPGSFAESVGAPCCVEVRAPVSGRILRIIRESESVVAAGEPLLEIGDPRQLEIVADLLSSDAMQARVGAQVLIEAWGGGGVLNGRVRRVEPYGFTKVSALGIEEQRVNVIIDFADPPAAGLGHGYRVEVGIVVWQAEDVLRVPLGALFRVGEAWAVFVEADGRSRLREVGIGHRNSAFAEVLEGLEDGARVVLHPSDRIEDGSRIVERET
jgi:HlyD family secretion protein